MDNSADNKRKDRRLHSKLNALQQKSSKKGNRKPSDDLLLFEEKSEETETTQSKPAPRQDAAKDLIIYHRDIPHVESSRKLGRSGSRVVLEEVVDGEELAHQLHGKAFLSTTPIDTIVDAQQVSETFAAKLADADSGLYFRVSDVYDPRDLTANDFIFMDIETTGLGNSPVFLIGIMVWNGEGFEVRQYLARNYAEEKAILHFFNEICGQKKVLTTFNGKSFDFPYLRTRCAACGIPFKLKPAHLDLLHVGRRIWKGQFSDCKLQTLEYYVCSRLRHGDIPGSEIPEAYHAYVRTENAWQIVEVLKHNLLDLVTLADLMTRFPDPEKKEDLYEHQFLFE